MEGTYSKIKKEKKIEKCAKELSLKKNFKLIYTCIFLAAPSQILQMNFVLYMEEYYSNFFFLIRTSTLIQINHNKILGGSVPSYNQDTTGKYLILQELPPEINSIAAQRANWCTASSAHRRI